jgi:uncharacterized protein YecE (DUF72 family)
MEEESSKQYLIGTGGWSYFRISGISPLVAYSRAFDFVEVNSTFYRIPSLKEVEKWRRTVPSDFEFSVRAHKSITHTHRLQPTREALDTFEKIKQVCSTLKANFLHLQTPSSFGLTQAAIKGIQNFLSSISPGRLRVALEIRGVHPNRLPSRLSNIMQDHNVLHCTDVSKGEMPAYDSDMLYSRLFGRGEHNMYQPTDEELVETDNRVSNINFQKVVLSFHFVRMYKDAIRLKIYKQTGKFPRITRSTGLSSLEEVLREDTSFPTTKQELLQNQGWKLLDLSEDKKIRAQEFLRQLPEGTYNNTNEIIASLIHENR